MQDRKLETTKRQWFTWLRRLLGLEDPYYRYDSFLAMLRTRAYGIKAPVPPAPTAAWERLDRFLKGTKRDWNEAYEAEGILDWLIDDAVLGTVFDAREEDAKGVVAADRVTQRRKEFGAATTNDAKRLVLQALDEDLHEQWAEGDEKLDYYEQITFRTASALVVSTLTFVSVLVIAHRSLFDWTPHIVFTSFTSVRLLAVVCASGFFGACLSMLIGLRGRLDAASMPDLEKMNQPVNLVARAVVGAGAGLVLFALVAAEFLGGKLVPKLPLMEAMSDGTLAHLVAVCIVAGFSEKMVPSALAKAESDS